MRQAGTLLGVFEGNEVVELAVGNNVGSTVGVKLGAFEGCVVEGLALGNPVGVRLGNEVVGTFDGLSQMQPFLRFFRKF